MKKIIAWCRSLGVPQSLATLAKKYRRAPSTSKIYVIKTDFAVSPEHIGKINHALAPIREKYNLDFVVLEPGMTLERFDDF